MSFNWEKKFVYKNSIFLLSYKWYCCKGYGLDCLTASTWFFSHIVFRQGYTLTQNWTDVVSELTTIHRSQTFTYKIDKKWKFIMSARSYRTLKRSCLLNISSLSPSVYFIDFHLETYFISYTVKKNVKYSWFTIPC